MTQSLKGKIAKEKNVLLLRKYQEEMLDACLTEDAYFPELLRYCNIMFEFLSIILHRIYDFASDTAACKLATIAIVAAGYGGDMPEALTSEFLNDMDFQFNKVKCRKISSYSLTSIRWWQKKCFNTHGNPKRRWIRQAHQP